VFGNLEAAAAGRRHFSHVVDKSKTAITPEFEKFEERQARTEPNPEKCVIYVDFDIEDRDKK
jgi:hypothetical protein